MGNTFPTFPKAIQFLRKHGSDVLSSGVFPHGHVAEISYKGQAFRFTHVPGCMEVRHYTKGLRKVRRLSELLKAMDTIVHGGSFSKSTISVDIWYPFTKSTSYEIRFNFQNVVAEEQEAFCKRLRTLAEPFSVRTTPLTKNRQVILEIPEAKFAEFQNVCFQEEILDIPLKWNDFRSV